MDISFLMAKAGLRARCHPDDQLPIHSDFLADAAIIPT